MTSTATQTVSLREPFIAALRERFPTVEVVEKKAYAAVREGKKTLANVNGDRKLLVTSPALRKAGHDATAATSEADFAKILDQIADLREKLAAPPQDATVKAAAAEAIVETPEPEVTPDPKPEKKKRAPRKRAAAKKAAKA